MCCIAVVMSFGALAQSSSSALDMITITPSISPDDFEADIQKVLFNKLLQTVTQKGVGGVDSRYLITPKISILTSDATTTSPPQYLVSAELMLAIWDYVGGAIIGELTIPIKGVDMSQKRAMLMAINQFNPRSATVRKFVGDARAKIDEYYTNNMATILKQVEVLIAQEKYKEANDILMSVPMGTPAYEQSSDAILAIVEMMAQKSCNTSLAMAQRAFDIGDYDQAKRLVMAIKAGSPCDEQATILAQQIVAKIEALAPEKESNNR